MRRLGGGFPLETLMPQLITHRLYNSYRRAFIGYCPIFVLVSRKHSHNHDVDIVINGKIYPVIPAFFGSDAPQGYFPGIQDGKDVIEQAISPAGTSTSLILHGYILIMTGKPISTSPHPPHTGHASFDISRHPWRGTRKRPRRFRESPRTRRYWS